MDINSIIDKLSNELDKLNNVKNQNIDTNSFFTDNEHFNDDFSFDDTKLPEKALKNSSFSTPSSASDTIKSKSTYEDIEPDNETISLVTIKEQRLLTIQNMFKKSIRVSLKSFLISISLSFLNLFI